MHIIAELMRPYLLIFILLAAAMSPLIDLSDNEALADQNSTEPGDSDIESIPSVGILATVVAILVAVIPRRKSEF